MGTLTPKLGLKKPTPNVEEDWGYRHNENSDLLDDSVLADNLSGIGNITINNDGAGNITVSGSRNLIASTALDIPTDSEDLTLFRMPDSREATIQNMFAVIRPSDSLVAWTIRHGLDRNGTGEEVVVGGTVTTNHTVGDNITTFNNPIISGGRWVWLETTTTTGTPQELAIEIFGT